MEAQRYTILYRKSVEKDLRLIPKTVLSKIISKVENLSTNPFPAGSIRLQGSTNRYRLRHGDYRIIYDIRDNKLIILIIKIGHRRDVYRGV